MPVNEDNNNDLENDQNNTETDAFNQKFVFNLYVELFSQGNLILTDFDGKILAILRPIETESIGKLSLGEYYNPYEKALELKLIQPDYSFDNVNDYLKALPPQIIEYILKTLGIESKKSKKTPHHLLSISEEKREKFIELFNGIIEEINSESRGGTIQINRISCAEDSKVLESSDLLNLNINNTTDDEITLHSYESLERMTSHVPEQCKIRFASFNDAVDVFYARLEAERASQKKQTIEGDFEKKLRIIEEEQKERIRVIEVSMTEMLEKANIITENAERIDAAIAVTRTAMSSGLDWAEFWRLIQSEQKSLIKKRADVAKLFIGLNLEAERIILKLEDRSIEIDFNLTAHGNATRLFEQRGQLKLKLERTLKSHEMAMKSAAMKIKSDSNPRQRIKKRGQLQVVRKPFWFEKFHWFVSGDGYLAIAGRDPKQSELIIKKYLKRGDVLVYSDAVEGAAIVIIKNKASDQVKNETKNDIVPLKTLVEAGMFSVSFSNAWEEKRVSNSWWVSSDQVTISECEATQSDSDLPEIMVKGPKHFLPPTPINISFGFLLLLDEEGRNMKRKEREAYVTSEIREDAEFLLKMKKYQVDEDIKNEDVGSSVTVIHLDSRRKTECQEKVSQKPTKAIIPKQQKIITEVRTPPVESSKAQDETTKSVRGKHGKEKKMKKKYGNQDEEERNLRLELLGSAGKTKALTQNTTSSTISSEPKPSISQTKAKTQTQGSVQNTIEVTDGVLDLELEDLVLDEFVVSDYFSMTPNETENYLFAIPVCFPTTALSAAQLRVKLVPGTQKKGKAVKMAVGLLTTMTASEDVKSLIRAVSEDEMIAVMPGKVAFSSELVTNTAVKNNKNSHSSSGNKGKNKKK